MTNVMNRWIKRKFNELRFLFGNKCLLCPSEYRLEFAHIKPTELKGEGRGRKERYYDILNNPDSYILLCQLCHRGL